MGPCCRQPNSMWAGNLRLGPTADLDGDGRPDLVTANLASNTLSLLLSSGARDLWLVRAVSAASGTAVVAPGSLATLYASTSVPAAALAYSRPWPTSLGGIGLGVRDSNGTIRLAPLLYVSDNQINFLVPEETALGEATLGIVRDGVAERGYDAMLRDYRFPVLRPPSGRRLCSRRYFFSSGLSTS